MSQINQLDTKVLLNVVESIQKDWNKAKTTWKASAQWDGGFRVKTGSRGFTLVFDEPEILGGTNTAANPVEVVLQAYGACLVIGYTLNASVRGIELEDIKIDLEGDIDLPGFLGLNPPEDYGLDNLPGYKGVRVDVKIKAKNVTPDVLKELHEHVFKTSPVGITLARSVRIESNLEVI